MEISNYNDGFTGGNLVNTITIDIAHDAYILVEQLKADRYRVSLHSHHSESFAVHSWVKPWKYADTHVVEEALLGGKPYGYVINAQGLVQIQKRALFAVKKLRVQGELPMSLSEQFASEYDQAVSVS